MYAVILLFLLMCLPVGYALAQQLPAVEGATSVPVTNRALQLAAQPAPANQAPTASFRIDCVGLRCQLNAGASTDPDGTIVHYQWMIGHSALSTAMDFRYAFTKPGRYRIELTVTDNQRQKASQSRDIVVSDPTVYPLPPNQQLSQLHGAQGQVLSYRLSTSQPQQRVTITARGGQGPLQLAARLTRPPSPQHADCRQQRRRQQVRCQLLLTKPGTVYLQLQGLADFQDVTLRADIESGRPRHTTAHHSAQQQRQPAVAHQHLQHHR